MRVDAVVALALIAVGCGGPTGVELSLGYEASWNLWAVTIQIRGDSQSVQIAPKVTVLVDDEAAEMEQLVEVWGLHDQARVAYGGSRVEFVEGQLVQASITLRAVDCTTPCAPGAKRCENDAVQTCLEVDGCGVWSEPMRCSAPTPFCAAGACAAMCVDDCVAGAVMCDSASATRSCGNTDGDPCLEWSSPMPCPGMQTCTSGTCADQCTAPVASWTRPSLAAAPSARDGHAMVWDAARGEVLLFGGGRGPGVQRTYFGDTWRWNGTAWTEVTTATAPSPRDHHAMAYEASTQTVLLFGGGAGTGTQRSYFEDTWRWNGSAWQEVSEPQPPVGRDLHTLTYDAARQRVMMFGGGRGTGTARGYSNETFVWQNGAWADVTPMSVPTERDAHAAVYDPVRQGVVMFAGGQGTGTARSTFDDVWLWNGTSWTAAPTGPTDRDGAAMSFDTARQVLSMFGGNVDFDAYLNDLWGWRAGAWQDMTPAMSPSHRDQHDMVYDPVRQTTVMFGGGIGVAAQRSWSSETWLLRNTCP